MPRAKSSAPSAPAPAPSEGPDFSEGVPVFTGTEDWSTKQLQDHHTENHHTFDGKGMLQHWNSDPSHKTKASPIHMMHFLYLFRAEKEEFGDEKGKTDDRHSRFAGFMRDFGLEK